MLLCKTASEIQNSECFTSVFGLRTKNEKLKIIFCSPVENKEKNAN